MGPEQFNLESLSGDTETRRRAELIPHVEMADQTPEDSRRIHEAAAARNMIARAGIPTFDIGSATPVLAQERNSGVERGEMLEMITRIAAISQTLEDQRREPGNYISQLK